MRTCIEGCGNILTPADESRFPESLSRPLPDPQQGIWILNMRLRCSSCYDRKYNKKYYAISYRWSHENRNHSFATVTLHDEITRAIRPGVPIPVRNQKQRSVIMGCRLFFLDVLNASSRSGQWYTSNLWRTYTSCRGVMILLGASDHQLLNGSRREGPLHQSGMTRDRDGYLHTKYGKQERASAYMNMPPGNVRFYSMYGRDMGNIEVDGLVPKEHNVYQDMLQIRSHLLYGSGNTRAGGAAIAKMFATPAAACVTTPADLDTVGFAVISPLDTTTTITSDFGTSPNVPSLDSSLNLTGIGGSSLGYDLEAPLIPSLYNPSLDLTDISGSAELLYPGMDPSATTRVMGTHLGTSLDLPPYMYDSSLNSTFDTSMASMTDNLSGMRISSESGHSFDPHFDYVFHR